MSEDMRQEDTNMKFKNLPQKEQEGYVINYTDPIKIKVYLLCYQNMENAIKKLKYNTATFNVIFFIPSVVLIVFFE